MSSVIRVRQLLVGSRRRTGFEGAASRHCRSLLPSISKKCRYSRRLRAGELRLRFTPNSFFRRRVNECHFTTIGCRHRPPRPASVSSLRACARSRLSISSSPLMNRSSKMRHGSSRNPVVELYARAMRSCHCRGLEKLTSAIAEAARPVDALLANRGADWARVLGPRI